MRGTTGNQKGQGEGASGHLMHETLSSTLKFQFRKKKKKKTKKISYSFLRLWNLGILRIREQVYYKKKKKKKLRFVLMCSKSMITCPKSEDV